MHKELTYQINGCLFRVFNQLKNIWQEEVYEEALELELLAQGLHVKRQQQYDVFYFNQQVGRYRLDILVEDIVIVELKAVQEIQTIDKAQLISYLKGYNKPLGILANFGGKSLYHETFPNKLDQKNPLTDTFDFNQVQLKGKEEIKELLLIANRILITLGPGYFHKIYRKAFYYELRPSQIQFEVIKKMTAVYHGRALNSKEVNFFLIGDLLLSVVAVKALNQIILSRFAYHIKHFNCKRGLIVNFNAVRLDYRYLENL
ncbi:MAG: hypothetical protein DRR08_23805 [Candidatus Parabeggiatoa sp. nov. 2]|nr:MAG: hypothetical protein B6247_03425 [Beggiatoa sp. 4572_84]RKZ55628.1 MAG: hypothetical protein DRR08_23805 [Gammaproteobacteria bacterium]